MLHIHLSCSRKAFGNDRSWLKHFVGCTYTIGLTPVVSEQTYVFDVRVLLRVLFCQARNISLADVGVTVIFSFMLTIYYVLLQLLGIAVGEVGWKQLRLQVAHGVLARVLAAPASFLQGHTCVPAVNPIKFLFREYTDTAVSPVFRARKWCPFIPLIKLLVRSNSLLYTAVV